MAHVAVIGCGVVGAAIAYELSQVAGLQVTVLDRQFPAQAATGAALGVLMGIIGQRVQGRAWTLRQMSMQRYPTLILELENATGHTIPRNQHGILQLCFAGDELENWQNLIAIRRTQGWQLERWEPAQIQAYCPHVQNSDMVAAIYSPQDFQVDPTALTFALVDAAKRQGVTFQFDVQVQGWQAAPTQDAKQVCHQIETSEGRLAVDWLIIAAGLGSTALTQTAQQPVDIRPVLGQAVQLHLDQPLGDPDFQPIISGNDVHVVPLANGDYWVGATVEFPVEDCQGKMILPLQPDPNRLAELMQGAIALCPALSQAKILKIWSGLRPRPYNRSAPIIEPLVNYTNILLATGHYRNGILLAPATALVIRGVIEAALPTSSATSRTRSNAI
jgi:glycine/D-amino acid oxidase-like deaminating enzyme